MSVKIGKAKFGGQTQRKYFKLKDGEQAYRILPPLGELADQGKWSVFHSVHYGYKSTDGKQKPFLSCEVKNRKSGMVEVYDAAKDRITTFKAKLEEAKKAGNKAAVDKLEPLVGLQGMYNLDNNHYMNVVDAQGNIGVLKIRHKAKLALEAEIKKLNNEGVDPLSIDNGRFFVFTRSGLGRDTTFGVSVLKEKLKVEGVGTVERDVVHALDEELQNRLGNEAAELHKIFKQLSAAEVKQVVDQSDLMTGVSPYLDKLFGKSQAATQDNTEGNEETESIESEPEAKEPVAAAPKTETKAEPASKPAAAKAPQVTKVAPKTTAALVTELSDDEFLQRLNDGTL